MHDPYSVLRNRDFLLYLIGRFVASLGQQMLTLAVGWELYDRTHSALALAMVGLTQMVPMVLIVQKMLLVLYLCDSSPESWF